MSYLPLTHPPRSLGFFICKMVTMFTSWLAAKINDPLHDRAPHVLPGMAEAVHKQQEKRKEENSKLSLRSPIQRGRAAVHGRTLNN